MPSFLRCSNLARSHDTALAGLVRLYVFFPASKGKRQLLKARIDTRRRNSVIYGLDSRLGCKGGDMAVARTDRGLTSRTFHLNFETEQAVDYQD